MGGERAKRRIPARRVRAIRTKTAPNMPDIFLSYKREDQPKARRIAEALIARGFHVWWDVELLPGDRFPEEIHRVIEASRAVLVLWSRKSVAARWVLEEAEHASNARKLFPARLDDVAPPFGFATVQTVDLSDWAARRGATELPVWFLDSLAEFLEKRPAPPGAPPETGPPGLQDYAEEAREWRRAVRSGRTARYLRSYGERGLFTTLADGITDSQYWLKRRLRTTGQRIVAFGTRRRTALLQLALALGILAAFVLVDAFIGFLPPATGF